MQSLGIAAANVTALEPADFDGDGLIDLYWCRANGAGDAVLHNTGNDAQNKATFETLTDLPPAVMVQPSGKATAADLNADGRVDVFVPFPDFPEVRPVVLRNTTVNGEISFIDWTPAPAFPLGMHRGWKAVAFDSDGDGDLDILLGGSAHDHLFENVPAVQIHEDVIVAGILPPLFDLDPVVVIGTPAAGRSDTFRMLDIVAPGFIAVVLNGPDDYRLVVLNPDDTVLAESDRGGAGVEEALQVDVDPVQMRIRVTVLGCAAAPHDLDGDCAVSTSDLLELLVAWGPDPGHPGDFDGDGVVGTSDLLALLAHWTGPVQYALEVLARS